MKSIRHTPCPNCGLDVRSSPRDCCRSNLVTRSRVHRRQVKMPATVIEGVGQITVFTTEPDYLVQKVMKRARILKGN